MSDERERQLEAIHEQVGAWAEDFARNPGFDRLSDTQKKKAMAVIDFFTEYSFSHVGVGPEKWTPGSVAECCVEVLPRKITADFEFFHSVAPVLSAFFTYLGEKSLLPDARVLAETVGALRNEIVTAAEDPRSWGPAKTFAMKALEAGVDMGNQAEVYAFMAKYNEEMFAQHQAAPKAAAAPPLPTVTPVPVRRDRPSVGRNDPCPCGSGRKYKKCCGT